MSFTQNDSGQRDIINETKTLTKLGSDTIHAIALTKYQKYPSTRILAHANVLAKVYQLPYGRLPYMTPREAYSITIYVRTITIEDMNHEQK